MKKQSVRLAWKTSVLIRTADAWFAQQRRKTDRWASETSPWWSFVHDWKKTRSARIEAFVAGTYRFRALQQYDFSTKDKKKDTVQSWTYEDRPILRLLWKIIAPVARKIISPHCYHSSNWIKSDCTSPLPFIRLPCSSTYPIGLRGGASQLIL